MRISDWSSDVCSSDLREGNGCRHFHPDKRCDKSILPGFRWKERRNFPLRRWRVLLQIAKYCHPVQPVSEQNRRRSEEHTSELQSLMRNSYAVFCLNTKIINKIKITKTKSDINTEQDV